MIYATAKFDYNFFPVMPGIVGGMQAAKGYGPGPRAE
jgi:hypothetical protein